jgi:hypothetical protein
MQCRWRLTIRASRRVYDTRLTSKVRRRKLHRSLTRTAIGLFLCVGLSACEQKPEFVFVLEAPQSVELAASASAGKVRVGQAVVLTAQRSTRGTWTRIPWRELKEDQCWMAAIPPESETAVADNLHWVVEPQGAASFNTDSRPDHTREAVFSKEGVVSFSSSTAVWCEPGRSVSAPPIRVEVTAK